MRIPLAGAILALGLALPSHAAATEFFATPDETKTTQDCLSEANACALGKALDALPFNTPSGNPFGVHVLTLLPGTYDGTDLDAGTPSDNFQIDIGRGATLRGKPGAPRPTIAIDDPGLFDPVIDLTNGGIVRDLIVDATAYIGIDAEGADASISGVGGDIPAIIERVTVISKPPVGQDASFGISLFRLARATNVDVDHRAVEGSAVEMTLDQFGAAGSPKLVGSTITSTGAAALAVSGGRDGTTNGSTPATQRGPVIGTVLRGVQDVLVRSDTSVVPNYVPNPIEVTLTNTATRSGTARRTQGPAVVTFAESGTVDAADLGLGADRAPTASSPLVNAGIADADLGATDLLGNARTVGPAPDIGAYEFAVAPPATPAPTPVPTAASIPTADRTSPLLAFALKSSTLKRSKLAKGKGVAIAATTNEAVTGGTLQLLTRTKRKGKTTEKVLATVKLGAKAVGPLSTQLKVRASKLGIGKRKAFLRLTLTDAAGNVGTTERAVTIK